MEFHHPIRNYAANILNPQAFSVKEPSLNRRPFARTAHHCRKAMTPEPTVLALDRGFRPQITPRSRPGLTQPRLSRNTFNKRVLESTQTRPFPKGR